MECSICGAEIVDGHPQYPNLVCDACDARVVNEDGEEPWYGWPPGKEPDTEEGVIRVPPDHGENPVFIDGQKC